MSERIKSAGKRYRLEFGAAMTFYMVVLFGAKFLADGVEPGAWLTTLAIAPVVPIVFACIAFFRYYGSLDERERRLMSDAAALSLVIGIFTALTLGFLKSFGVFHFEWDMLWFGPFLIALWGIVRCALLLKR